MKKFTLSILANKYGCVSFIDSEILLVLEEFRFIFVLLSAICIEFFL